MGGAFSLMLLLVFFFMPETAFHRPAALNIDGGASAGTSMVEEDEIALKPTKTNTTTGSQATSTDLGLTKTKSRSPTRVSGEQRISYWKELMPYSGYWDTASFLSAFVRPFVMWGSPIVLWASFMFTATLSWLVLVSFVLSQIFSAPPYNFSITAASNQPCI